MGMTSDAKALKALTLQNILLFANDETHCIGVTAACYRTLGETTPRPLRTLVKSLGQQPSPPRLGSVNGCGRYSIAPKERHVMPCEPRFDRSEGGWLMPR
jgi:hypothetical protein